MVEAYFDILTFRRDHKCGRQTERPLAIAERALNWMPHVVLHDCCQSLAYH